MRVLFVVQGEGRGHFTQALAMKEILRQQGDQLVGVLVGKSSHRRLPDYFVQRIQVTVKSFESPDFLPSPHNKRPDMMRSIMANIGQLPSFYKSMRFIHRQIVDLQPDIVINFYELLTGLTYLFMPPGIPYVCIGHQYMFLHKDFDFPGHISYLQLALLRFFTRMTGVGAMRRLALSFYPAAIDEKEGITVVPPLIRQEVRDCSPENGEYVLGYMLNTGYVTEIADWAEKHPDTPLHFFWDKKEGPEVCTLRQNLILHRIHDQLFIRLMYGCRGYATTAGFESVCEALYLHKPVIMVPVHVEQECNAWDARKVGAGIVAEKFELDRLVEFIPEYAPEPEFRNWVDRAPAVIYSELKAVYRPSVFYRFYERMYQLCLFGNT